MDAQPDHTTATDQGPAVADPVASAEPGGGPAGGPADTSLAAVLGGFERDGWAGQFMPATAGAIRCLTCRREFEASQVDADRVRRLEGASDPADMVIVVPLQCPQCATRGVLVAHFGPEASGEEADVVAALSRSERGVDT